MQHVSHLHRNCENTEDVELLFYMKVKVDGDF